MSDEGDKNADPSEAEMWRIASYATPLAKQAAEQGITLEELMDRIALEYQEAKASGKVEVLEKYFSRIDIGKERG